METSLKAPELLVSPQPDETCSMDQELPEHEAAACASSGTFDPMQEFNRRLEDIIRTHGSADELQLSSVGEDTEKMEVKGDPVATETDVSLIKQSLNNLSTPEEKLEELIRKYAELAALRFSDEQKLNVLQQKLFVLMEERQQLHAERRSSNAARSKLETLCRELQAHYNMLREDTLRRCREDEEKRKEITTHFQETLIEIQAQIEQHSARNDKLCSENSNLTDKLESLMTQYERREESLEKINKHRDLQHKLTEAKLEQTNALLAEAQDKHKREKREELHQLIQKSKNEQSAVASPLVRQKLREHIIMKNQPSHDRVTPNHCSTPPGYRLPVPDITSKPQPTPCDQRKDLALRRTVSEPILKLKLKKMIASRPNPLRRKFSAPPDVKHRTETLDSSPSSSTSVSSCSSPNDTLSSDYGPLPLTAEMLKNGNLAHFPRP